MKDTIEVSSDALSGMVAAYLKQGTPSALLVRIIQGMTEWEGKADRENVPLEDLEFTAEVRVALEKLQARVRAAETDYYAAGATTWQQKCAIGQVSSSVTK